MKQGYYWVKVKGKGELVAERVIDPDGEDFWHLTGDTETYYDKDVLVISEVNQFRDGQIFSHLRAAFYENEIELLVKYMEQALNRRKADEKRSAQAQSAHNKSSEISCEVAVLQELFNKIYENVY